MNQNLFDLSEEYDEMLNRGLAVSGESKAFFMRGRVHDLVAQLPEGYRPGRILDFGCGIGDTAKYLSDLFPEATVIGVDNAESALAHAREIHGACTRVLFQSIESFSETETIDLCYVNGVFHHIHPDNRPEVIKWIYRSLKPGGYFALFENNPWNPGTRMVMKRIPFDRDAQTLTHLEVQNLLRAGNFVNQSAPRFLFYFPRTLAFLRVMETYLARLPFGAQYYILAVK